MKSSPTKMKSLTIVIISLIIALQHPADAQVPDGFWLIPAGAFTMGRTSGDTDSNAASPVTVTVSAFYMGKYEVTKAQWDEVRTWGAEAGRGYTDLPTGGGKAANHPVHTISWFDMVKWCNARSQKDGLTPVYTVSGAVMKTGTTAPTANWSANGYRLPTEAEWEKAARGGVSGKRFPWGTDTISHSQANYSAAFTDSYDLSAAVNSCHPTYATGPRPYTSPVGSFAANGYGLFDMAGNIWEWCWDWYGGSTYVDGATDPRGAASGAIRVYRGGGWYDVARRCRAANRGNSGAGEPSRVNHSIGFRLALTQPVVHPWTNTDDKTIQAEFVRLSGESVVIRKDGKESSIAFSKLSPASVEQARKLADSTRQAPDKP